MRPQGHHRENHYRIDMNGTGELPCFTAKNQPNTGESRAGNKGQNNKMRPKDKQEGDSTAAEGALYR